MDNRIISLLRRSFLLDPVFYLTIALFVGEATLAVIGFPIRLNSSVMYVVLLAGIVLSIRKPMKLQSNWVFALYGYLLLRSIPLNSTILTQFWMPNLMTLILFCLLYGYCANDKKHLHDFLRYTYGFLMILMLLGLMKVVMGDNSRLAVFGGPNGYYKFALFFHALSFIKYLTSKQLRYLLFMGLGVILALLTGSKGAIVTLCILLPVEAGYYLFLAGTSSRERRRRALQLLGISILAVVVLAFALKFSPQLTKRWGRLIAIFSAKAGQLTSVTARARLLTLAWEYFCEAPVFGKGAMYMYLDTLKTGAQKSYAHNVFFELLSEHGITGFFLLWAILLKLLGGMKKKFLEDLTCASLYLGFLVYFLGAQFSGNILDSKVFLCFGMLILLYQHHHMGRNTQADRLIKKYFKREVDDL